MKILVVEDEALILRLLNTLLTRLGHTVHDASDGQKGLDAYLQDPSSFDLVITDIEMPRMDGMGMVAKLENLGHTPCIIFITAQLAPSEIAVGNVIGFLSKPISLEELVQLLESVEGE